MRPHNSTQTTFVLEMLNDPKCGPAGQQAPELQPLHLAENADTYDFSNFLSPFDDLSGWWPDISGNHRTTPLRRGSQSKESQESKRNRIHSISKGIER